MKTRFSFIDPGAIMGVVVALIMLAVGVFIFFVTNEAFLDELPPGVGAGPIDILNNTTRNAQINVTGIGDSVFNIVGIVLLIGAIMSIVGLVYNYVR